MSVTAPRTGLLPDPELHGEAGIPATPAAPDEDSVLARAAEIRFPDIREMSGADRVEALVDHITATAIARGEVEELRLQANVELLNVRKQLGRLPGIGRPGKTSDDIKRRTNPELAEQEEHWQWIVSRCTEQINRLGGSDYDAASRAYTLLSGT